MKNSDPYRILTRYYNSQPFRIVIEYYDIECANLYEVVKSLFKYPDIQEDDTLESFIYASAFAYICRDFLNRGEHKDLHGNFTFLLIEMNYDEDDIKLLKQRLSTETLGIDPKFYGELIWAVINDYKKIINNDLKKLLKTNENIENFMCSTLGFNDMDSSLQIMNEVY